MNNLTTRKIVLGLLMALVLTFSVQGIADAADLPLSKTSGDLQTESVDDQFKISFRVGIRSNTTRITNSAGKLIDDSDTPVRIDSSGYPVTPIDGRDYRNTQSDARDNLVPETPNTPAAPSDVGDSSTYAPYAVYKRVSSNQYEAYSGTIYADSSKNAFSDDGYPLYYYTPAFDYDSDDADSVDDKTASHKVGPRIKIIDEDFGTRVIDAKRYHYNEEAITITVNGAQPSADTMTFKLDAAGYQRDVTELAEDPDGAPNRLPSSVTLVCTPGGEGDEQVGTYTVRIEDTTPVADRPDARALNDRAYIEFTLHVVGEAVVDEATVTIAPTDNDDDKFHAGETLRIDDDFTLEPDSDTILIQYSVLSGPGTIFERTSPDDTTTPTKSHLTSSGAQVYLILNNGNSVVRAAISGDDPVRDGAEITYTYTGTGARRTTTPTTPTPPTTTTGSLTIVVTGTGATRSVTVNAVSAAGTPTAIPAVLTGTATSTQTIITGTATEITLPTAPGSYTLTATASVAGYNPDTETITVAGPTSLGTISISQIGSPNNGVQTFSITVRDTDAALIAGALTVRVSGSGFTTSSVPTANGSGAVDIALPTTTSLYTLTASAEGYTSGTAQVRGIGTGQQEVAEEDEDEVEEEVVTVSEPDSVSIVGPSQRDGTANTVLDAALIVEVVDEDGDAVADARVIFRVRTGQGRLSERGNGRAVAVQTNSSGHARATYTPISASSTVEAEARGVTRRVTFTITASGGSAGPVSRDADGTPSGDISPVVHVGAAQRPPMLWVDGGAIYALVGASPERFAPSVDNALNLTVGGGKVYWTEKTGESGGTINSANVDGSGVTELASIFATPMGIAVDVTNSKLYWTNSAGRIQSANLDGSRITNVIPGGLETPMDLALAGGNAYWTQGNGNVRFVNLTSRQNRFAMFRQGRMPLGVIVIGGGKVYWTEKTGESGGTSQ